MKFTKLDTLKTKVQLHLRNILHHLEEEGEDAQVLNEERDTRVSEE